MTFTAGQKLRASELNDLLTVSRCSVSNPGFNVSNSTSTVVSWTAKTSGSLASMWSASSPTRLIVPSSGEYDLSLTVRWAANATGQRSCSYSVNGAALGPTSFFHTWNAVGGAFGSEQSAILRGIALTAGQYVELFLLQNSGVALSTGQVTATLSKAL